MKVKRWITIIIGILIIVARVIYPKINIDIASLWILFICLIAFFLPEIKKIFPYIKKIKILNTEITTNENIKKIGKKIPEVAENLYNAISLNDKKNDKEKNDEIIQKQLDEIFKIGIDLGKSHGGKYTGGISNVKLVKNNDGTTSLQYDEQ